MSKPLAAHLARALTLVALAIALVIPASPSFAGCPVCAIIKTTPAGRAMPDDNDFSIFDMLDLRDSLILEPIATGFPATTQVQVGFLMSSTYYSQTLARVGGIDNLDILLGASLFAEWTDFTQIPFSGINTLFVLGSSLATNTIAYRTLSDFGDPSDGNAFSGRQQLVMNEALFLNGEDGGSWSTAGDRVVEVRIPEPASLALLGLGLVGVAVARRRRRG